MYKLMLESSRECFYFKGFTYCSILLIKILMAPIQEGFTAKLEGIKF